MSEGESERMNKAQRLAVAGAVAPFLRDGATAANQRKVTRVDKDNNIVGYTTLAKVQEAILERHKIEIAVQPDVRPKEVICEKCGKFIKVSRTGVVASLCSNCADARCEDCGKTVKGGGRPEKDARRKGLVRCRECRDEALRKYPRAECNTCGATLGKSTRARVAKTGRPSMCASCFVERGSKKEAPSCACGATLSLRRLSPSAVAKSGGVLRCRSCAYRELKKTENTLPKCVDCQKELSARANDANKQARRGGTPARCRSCAVKSRRGGPKDLAVKLRRGGPKDLAGQRFGKLVPTKLSGEQSKNNGPIWVCECDCGSEHSAPAYSLLAGSVQSCGCVRRGGSMTCSHCGKTGHNKRSCQKNK